MKDSHRNVVSGVCRQLDKFKPVEVCNLVWGLAQLSPQGDIDLLREVLAASDNWSEVSNPSMLNSCFTGAPFV